MVVPVRRVLQAGAVLLLLALVGLFAKSLLDNHTSVSTQLADGRHPAAPNFTLDKIPDRAPRRCPRSAARWWC